MRTKPEVSKPLNENKLKTCNNKKKSVALWALRCWKRGLVYQIDRIRHFIFDNHEKQRLLVRMISQREPKKKCSKKGVDKTRRHRMMAERWLVDSQNSRPEINADFMRSIEGLPSNFHHEEKLGNVERKLIMETSLQVTRNEKLWKVLDDIKKEGYDNVDLEVSRKNLQDCAGHPLVGFNRDEDEVRRRDGGSLLSGFTNKMAW